MHLEGEELDASGTEEANFDSEVDSILEDENDDLGGYMSPGTLDNRYLTEMVATGDGKSIPTPGRTPIEDQPFSR